MSNFFGFTSPRQQDDVVAEKMSSGRAAPTNFAANGHGGHAKDHDFTIIQMPILADDSLMRLSSNGGHGAIASPAIIDDMSTPTAMLSEETTTNKSNKSNKTNRNTNTNANNKTTNKSYSTSLSLHGNNNAGPHFMGDEPHVPRVFLSYAHCQNSFFAKRLLRVSIALSCVMVTCLGVYYFYHPKRLVLDPAYPTWYGFTLRDPGRVYLLQATSCENLIGFSALVFHSLPMVILLGMPGTGIRFFEPFKRESLRDDDGRRNKIKRTLMFQFCELMGVAMLIFAMLVFLFFWYMFFNNAAFACGTIRAHVFALCGLFCYGAIFVEVVYFVRYREHIKMQLGAFKESDQTGGIRKHLLDVAAAELMTKDKQIISLIRKRLYKATRLGDLREMRQVLELATSKKLDQKGFPMKFYGNAKIYMKLFGMSKKNPVHVAAYNGNIDALELLLGYGFEMTTLDKFSRVRFSTGDLFLYFAHFFIAKPVVSDEEDAVSIFKTTLVTPLHCAVSTGQLEAVRWLISHGAEVGTIAQSSYRSQRIPPIFLAETPGVVRELLENGANHLAIPDPGYMNTLTALQLAYLRGNFSVAQELEEWGCDVALTPFHSAAASNDTASVRKYIRRGTHLDCLGEHGYWGMNRRTPLHWAAVNGAIETVELLLEAGAQPNFQDARGRTALHWAARLNMLSIVKTLLAKGALPNLADVDHMTPLVCAASARHATRELFSVLVEANADINYHVPTTGDTALHIAVREENQEAALALLACGGNIMKVNHLGLRPLDCSTDTKLLFTIKRAAGHRDVMISYTHSHAQFAQKLRKSLEDANVTTWLDLMDPSGIGGGAVWREEIARGITNAALVVCILTEDYAASEWCLKELALAKQAGTPILAVSTEGITIGEELQVYLYTRQIIPFEPCITETKRNLENAKQIEYEYEENKYKSQFRLLLDGVRDEIEKRRDEMVTKRRRRHATAATVGNGNLDPTAAHTQNNSLSIVSAGGGFSKMFQPWDAPGSQYVFVSHGDRHATFVRRLCHELKEKDISFYGDRNMEGHNFDHRIHQAKDAILKCTCFIVILSKDTMQNELVRDQLAFAEDKGRPIFPIVLNDVEIGHDKRYSLARTDFYHFLGDGFAFASSFESLFTGIKQYYGDTSILESPLTIKLPASFLGRASPPPRPPITWSPNPSHGGGNSNNTSFVSNSSFVSFLQAAPSSSPSSSYSYSSASASSASSSSRDPSFCSSDDSETPYLAAKLSTVSSRLIDEGEVIHEDQEQNTHSFETDSLQNDDNSFGQMDNSIRNFDSISSLGSEERANLDLVRM